MEESTIENYYANKTVLVTGATGYMGKILVEKLLRSCPDVNKIILIVRDKKSKTAKQRIIEYFNDSVFDVLKESNANYSLKLQGFVGNLTAENLGLKANDMETLANEVDVIFHMAATVNFIENLHESVAINIQGTKNVLNLAKKINRLEAFIHVSTAYSNCVQMTVEEKIYESPLSPEAVQSLVQHIDEKLMEKITPAIIGEYPNTYVFTKNIAETLIKQNADGLPIGIFRPAIVTSTYKEPLPGWINNYNGPAAISVGIMTGLCKIVRCANEVNAHMVPVDLAINCLLASAWDIGTNRKKDIPIYNFTAETNPCSWKMYRDHLRKTKYPLECALFHPWHVTLKISLPVYKVMLTVFHNIPAKILDFFLKISGQKPRLSRSYQKLNLVLLLQSYFTMRQWHFTCDNVHDLWEKLTPRDKATFNFNMKSIVWDTYIQQMVKGIKIYLLKEDMKNIKVAEDRRTRLNKIHNVFKTVYIITACYVMARVIRKTIK